MAVLGNRMNAFYSLRSMAIFLIKNLVNDSFYFCISLFFNRLLSPGLLRDFMIIARNLF